MTGRGATRAPRAFTLLEVMVAIAILAFALVSVSQIVAASLRSQVLARDLEVATLLARGKMAELTEKYEREGFPLGGGGDDGSFEDDGHPEVRWETTLIEPPSTLDGKALASLFMGGTGSLEALLGPKADANGVSQVNPAAGAMAAMVEAQLSTLASSVKNGVRELRLRVFWKDGAREESFTVVTHLVSSPTPSSPAGALPIPRGPR